MRVKCAERAPSRRIPPELGAKEIVMAKGEALKSQIEALRNAIPELKGVLLASNEGLPIAHSFRTERIQSGGGDGRGGSSLGRRISDSMSAGTLGEVSIQPRKAHCLCIPRVRRRFWRGQPAGRQRRIDPSRGSDGGKRNRRPVLVSRRGLLLRLARECLPHSASGYRARDAFQFRFRSLPHPFEAPESGAVI